MVAVGGGRQEYEYEWDRSSAPPVCSSVGSVLIRRSVRLSAMAGRLARASWAGRAGRLCAAPGRSPTNAAASCSIACVVDWKFPEGRKGRVSLFPTIS